MDGVISCAFLGTKPNCAQQTADARSKQRMRAAQRTHETRSKSKRATTSAALEPSRLRCTPYNYPFRGTPSRLTKQPSLSKLPNKHSTQCKASVRCGKCTPSGVHELGNNKKSPYIKLRSALSTFLVLQAYWIEANQWLSRPQAMFILFPL